jgi:hypothetical protein
VIVLLATEDAAKVQHPELRSAALSRLQFLGSEDMLGGDTPSAVIVMEPGADLIGLSGWIGFDVLSARYTTCRFDESGYARTFEVLEEHSAFFEMVFVLSDYGDGAVVLVPKQRSIDADLLAMCAMHAVPAPQESP